METRNAYQISQKSHIFPKIVLHKIFRPTQFTPIQIAHNLIVELSITKSARNKKKIIRENEFLS